MTDAFSLEGKIALITGAGAGQGRVMAHALAKRGAEIWCADMDPESAAETAANIGGNARAYTVDVCNYTKVEACADAIRRAAGRLDVLINNAGVATKGARTHELALEDWHKVIDVNLHGVFHVTRAMLPLMCEHGGSIVNIASIVGMVGVYPGFPMVNANYAASKAAIIGFTRQVAAEYATEGVRANVMAPGWHSGSSLKKKAKLSDAESARFETVVATGTPMGRRGTPEEFAHLAAFLASDASAYITGQVLTQDGGWTAV